MQSAAGRWEGSQSTLMSSEWNIVMAMYSYVVVCCFVVVVFFKLPIPLVYDTLHTLTLAVM